MPLFDTHCHFDVGSDIGAILARARDAGLLGLLAMGSARLGNAAAIEAAQLAPGFARLALGIDPEVPEECPDVAAVPDVVKNLRELICEQESRGLSVDAIGEIGLDFSHGEDACEKLRQRELFAAQVRLAAELCLPCSIHCRGADAPAVALEVLRENVSSELATARRSGSMHCFVGEYDPEPFIELGFSFGISGIITFRNADYLRSVVPTLPRDRILLETDSPYLAPTPLRGRVCEPVFIVHTATRLAETLSMSDEKLGELTTSNASRVFGLYGEVAKG